MRKIMIIFLHELIITEMNSIFHKNLCITLLRIYFRENQHNFLLKICLHLGTCVPPIASRENKSSAVGGTRGSGYFLVKIPCISTPARVRYTLQKQKFPRAGDSDSIAHLNLVPSGCDTAFGNTNLHV
jgi:hypothetical protein